MGGSAGVTHFQPWLHMFEISCNTVYVDDELLDLFTIDEAVEKMGFGIFQLLVAVFAGFVWVSTYMHVCSYVHTYHIHTSY